MSTTWKKLKKSLIPKISSNHDRRRSSSTSSTNGIASSPSPTPSHTSVSRSSSLLSYSFNFRSSKKICAICLGSLKKGEGQAIFTAECSHPFHFNCIATNVQHGNRICPICRCEWKDIPFQAPNGAADTTRRNNTMGRARVSPYNVSLQDSFISGLPLHLLQPPPPPQSEPDLFSDDEPLPAIQAGPAAASTRAQPITIKALPEFPAVLASEAASKFAVLVGIRAPPFHVDLQQLDRAPIDLVAVLDVSGSMSSKLRLLKRAVCFIIQNLGPSDRLSIVTFSASAQRILPLRRMSSSGHDDAIRAVNGLTSSGGTNIVEGLKKGVRVLEERREHNPIASIILLSDGHDTLNGDVHGLYRSIQNQSTVNPRQNLQYLNLLPASICPRNEHAPRDESRQLAIPVHTFGFGFEHDSNAMHAISDISGGTYSFIESIDMLQDAFARCIGGLLSVVAQDVQLKMQLISPEVQIVSISSGRYKSEIMSEGQTAIIEVGSLYADEEKEFLVYLSIPASTHSESEGENNMSLLDVMCSYKASTTEIIQSRCDHAVEIRRPEVLSPTDSMVCLEVDRQRNRLSAAEAIANAQRMAEGGDLVHAQAVLSEQRTALLSSASGLAGDALCNWLEEELNETRLRMANKDLYEHIGRAYVLAGLSSHSWQRATTRGQGNQPSTSSSISYETPSMVNMVSKSQILNLGSSSQNPHPSLNKSCSLIQRNK
ncbi:Zinc finger, RING-type [Corchorus capsularis]|uniref:Zinc finger, RING-type n=1 Tax=Corchorus capsularis TaxID=210143 RepID=A0A1R3HJP6_COCAP|nr:Zinc finger, RING-type [Corchorus capsularis]